MKKIFLIACVLFAPVAMAAEGCGENCVPQPKCENLGYKDIRTVTCSDGYIYCPFDRNYVWCRQYTCADGGLSDENNPSNGKSCSPKKFHGLDCFDCSQDKICRWTDYNKGQYAILSDVCKEGTYGSCEPNYLKMWRENPGTLLKLPDNAHAVDTLNYTVCGQSIPLYKKWECDDGYEEIEIGMPIGYAGANHITPLTDPLKFVSENTDRFGYVECKPISPSEGFSEISDCDGEDHPEGFVFEPDPAVSGYGKCSPKPCPQGYDTAANLTCDAADFFTIDAFSGNDQCGSCYAPDEDDFTCLNLYTWSDTLKSCVCNTDSNGVVLDSNGACICNPSDGWAFNGINQCECDYENGWSDRGEDACLGFADTLGGLSGHGSDTDCDVEGAIYNIIHGQDEGCYKVDDSSYTCDSSETWYKTPTEACVDYFGGSLNGDRCIKNGKVYQMTYNTNKTCVYVGSSIGCDSENKWFSTAVLACNDKRGNSLDYLENENECVVNSAVIYPIMHSSDGKCHKVDTNSFTCLESNSWYAQCPANANCQTTDNKCYSFISCKTGFVKVDGACVACSSYPDYYTSSCACNEANGYRNTYQGSGSCTTSQYGVMQGHVSSCAKAGDPADMCWVVASCKDGYKLRNGACVCPADEGYKENNTSCECEQTTCPTGASGCNVYDGCFVVTGCKTGYVLNENGGCDCDTDNGYEITSDGTCKKKKTQVVVLKNTLTGSSNGISENGTCYQSQASSTNMSGYLCQPKQTIRFYDCASTGSSSCTLIATYNEEKDAITGNTYTLSYYDTLALSVENTLSRCNYGIVYTGGMGNQYGYKCFRDGSEYSTFSNSGGTTIFVASQNKVYMNSTPSGGSPWFPQGVYHGSVGSATTPSTPVDVNITFSFSGCSPSSYHQCITGSSSGSDVTSSNTLVVKKGGTQVSATSGTTYKLTTGTTYTVGFMRPYCYRNGTSYSAHHVTSSGSYVANLEQPNNDTNTWKQFTFQPNGVDATVTITCSNWTSGW